ncbi:MAG: histidine triad nucleotide-binding protein [Firmicutes bacterium]|nr:histidine triad nucleotide-binding protein [Bacillota bacterium]
MDSCIFCQIVKKEIPAEILYEDDRLVVFRDIKPAAPVHLLFVPKKHIPTLMDLSEEDARVIGHLHLVSVRLARDLGLVGRGFRMVTNSEKDGGQLIYHLHYHFLGGRPLQWPPG